MRVAKLLFLLLVVGLLTAPWAAARGEPLDPAEIEQLRDTAQLPEKRIALYVKFIRTRVNSLAQLESDPRYTEDRSAQIHDRLDDITTLLDEMDDNIDHYADQADLRKPLKEAVSLDSELQTKLQAMKQRAALPNRNADAKAYAFALDNALEASSNSLDHARRVLAEQETRAKQPQKK